MADIYDLEIDLNADTSHSRTIRLTGRDKRVLDVGCATGYVSRILAEQFGCTVTGIEANPEAAAKARLRCQRVICGDAETLDYAKELDDERFDVVLFADVLEHLKDPWAVLRKIRDFIEPDGYVVASIPNIGHAAVVLELLAGRFAYRPFGLLDNTHLRFFNRRSIYELFESTGYVIEELSRIETAPSATEFQTDLAAFPPEIVDFALRREEATTFQFIVKACPATAAGSLAELRRRLEQFETSRDEESSRLEQGLEAARAALAAHEAEALELRQRLETAQAQHEAEALELRQRLETAQAQHEAEALELRHLETAQAQGEAEILELRQRLETAQAQHEAEALELRHLETAQAQGEAEILELRQRLETAQAQHEAAIASMHEHLGTTLGLLAQREAAAAHLGRDLGYTRELLAERQTEIAALRQELGKTTTQLRRDLDAGRSSLAEREASVDRLRSELAAHQAVIQGIVNSWSWRLTEPTRRLKAVLGRLREIGFARLLYWTLTLQLFTRLRPRRDLALIEGSGLFDASWYLSQYPDVARDGISPVLHYLQSGATEGRCPNPFFDTAWYLERYPDVARTGLNPLLHYLLVGAAEGRDPHPRFDTSAYLERYPDVAAAGINPLAHFIQRGGEEGRQADAVALSSHPDRPTTASASPGSDHTGSPDGASPIEDDYLDVSRRIADHRRHHLASLTFTPADMVHLDGRDLRAHARGLSFSRPSAPEVSIVIPVYNNLTLTLECLTSIRLCTEDVGYEIIVINDASTDDTRDVLSLISNLVYLENAENLGFLRTCNVASESARGQHLVFLNNDVQVSSGWLRSLLETFTQHDNVGAVGPKILYPNGRLQEAGSLINPDGSTRFVGLADDPARPRYNYPREVDYCSGVCLMLRTDTFREVGRFDERLAPAYYEDVDLCLRLRARGLRVIYNPGAVIVHHLSAASSSVDPSYKLACVTRNRQRILEAWLERIEALNQVRLIAFYLPQYHPIPENDRWWGKGFTEWTNVAKAQPSFAGHYQPHLPADLGFYDLRVDQVMEEQAALAQRYGIHGFCYYYYWFSGKRLLELPLERMLVTGKPDIPFCLCWANENWTRRWDGTESEILIGQQHSDSDDEAVIRDVIRYFRHPNYIRIDGRPLFLVYYTDRLPDMKRTADIWRRVCRAEGIGEIYLVNTETFQQSTHPAPPSNRGCDAGVEFPPHESASPIPVPGQLLNPAFTGVVSDYRSLVLAYARRDMPGYVRFRTVTPSWDNTARQPDRAYVFHRSSPGAFQAWLETAIEDTREQHWGEERIVFLNAWNEWAEGAHLEPDQRFGHGYLEAVRNALEHVAFGNVRTS